MPRAGVCVVGTGEAAWLSTEEVAQRRGVPAKTLAVWASGRRGPRFARIGRFRRYRLDDLLAWRKSSSGTEVDRISPRKEMVRRNSCGEFRAVPLQLSGRCHRGFLGRD
ncbi:helix-turn-helix domain-containing protein [Nocardia sp. NPDC051052]|uniref:helix-turn-helix domain-containing protein n=1 Tax=Nocardia sp. NPDC051052 TaxID=3364322 RepID=UPI003787A3D8